MTPAAIALTSRIRHLAVPGYGDDEIGFIADTVEALRPTHIYDWGTNVGASARIWWEAAPTAQITTVEHPDDQTFDHPGHRYGLWCEGLGPRMRMLKGDGVRTSIETFVEDGRPPNALFFLDGDHEYDAVFDELEAIHGWAPEAVVLVHDTSHPVCETEAAVEDFMEIIADGWYDVTFLASQAGMARLWPRNRP